MVYAGKKMSDKETQEAIELAKSGHNDVARVSLFSQEQLAEIDGYASAAAMLNAAGVVAESVSDYGTGFSVVKENSTLIGVPFLIIGWKFNEGKFGPRGFVSAEIVTKHNEKLIINDGSTGILAQLSVVTDQRIARGHAHPYAGLIVANGLTASEYFYNSISGEISRAPQSGPDWVPAQTYYLAQ